MGFTIIEVGITSSSSIGHSCLLVEGLINYYISAISVLFFTTVSYSSQLLDEERVIVTSRASWEDNNIFNCYLSLRIDHYMLTICIGVY